MSGVLGSGLVTFVAGPLLAAGVKAGVLLAAALAFGRWVPGLSAAVRHLVLLVAFGGSLALPVLALFAPGWGPALVPPVFEGGAGGAASAATDDPSPDSHRPGPAPAAAAPAPPAPEEGHVAPAWMVIAFAAWAGGVLLVLLRTAADRRLLRRIEHGARRVEDSVLRASLLRCSRELGLGRRVELVDNPAVRTPGTWGLSRPRIVLPTDAVLWPEERRRVVLLHELAHVLRRDSLSRAVARTACALFWFQPLAWLAARRLDLEAERAADDMVLSCGVAASTYLEELVDWIRRLRRGPAPAAAPVHPFAAPGRGDFALRAEAILETHRRRGAPSRRGRAAVLLLAALVATPLAGLGAAGGASEVLERALGVEVDAVLAPLLEKALLLGLEPADHDRFLEAAGTLDADAARQQVLVAYIHRHSLDRSRQLAVLGLIDGMRAVAARTDCLRELAATQDLGAEARRRYRRAAGRLDRPSARGAALAALDAPRTAATPVRRPPPRPLDRSTR